MKGSNLPPILELEIDLRPRRLHGPDSLWCSATATKARHIGELRAISIGQALFNHE